MNFKGGISESDYKSDSAFFFIFKQGFYLTEFYKTLTVSFKITHITCEPVMSSNKANVFTNGTNITIKILLKVKRFSRDTV